MCVKETLFLSNLKSAKCSMIIKVPDVENANRALNSNLRVNYRDDNWISFISVSHGVDQAKFYKFSIFLSQPPILKSTVTNTLFKMK